MCMCMYAQPLYAIISFQVWGLFSPCQKRIGRVKVSAGDIAIIHTVFVQNVQGPELNTQGLYGGREGKRDRREG